MKQKALPGGQMRKVALAIAALAAMSFASVASAAIVVTTYNLDTYDTSSVSWTDALIGTITVTDVNGAYFEIDAKLQGPFEFRQEPDTNHHTLVFQSDDSSGV